MSNISVFQARLKYVKMLVSDDVIDESEKEIHMTNLLKEIHTSEISVTKDGLWFYTYVKDSTKSGGRKQIKKHTKKELYQALLKWYDIDEQGNRKTVENVYLEWVEYKKQFVNGIDGRSKLSESTIKRYITDWNTYFAKTDFAKKTISKLTAVQIEDALKEIFEKSGIKERSAKNVFGYLNQCFEYAYRRDLVKGNLMDKVDKNLIYLYTKANAVHKDEDRVLTVSQMHDMRQAVLKQEAEHPEYMPNYAIELAMLTGMRVGELSALHWTDIDDNYIHVDWSEHRIDYPDKPSELRIGEPKYKKHRSIPITAEIRELFERMKALNHANKDGFIFVNEAGVRYTANQIGCACRRRGRDVGIQNVPIHRIRRTVSSMLNDKLSSIEVAAILGHTEDVNKRNYNYAHTEYNVRLNAMQDCSSIFINYEENDKKEKVPKVS